MARENHFVVIEHAKEMEVYTGNNFFAFTATRWPGKATKKPVVTGERMRIKLERAGARASAEGMDAHVILAEELRDFCIGLSILQNREGQYCTSGLSGLIQVHPPPYTETPAARDIRERTLLEPLQKLRHFQTLSIKGTLPAINDRISRQLTQQIFDRGLVLTAVDELTSSGNQASSIGEYDIATAYYLSAHEYLDHGVDFEPHIFTHQADISAFSFKIKQHAVLNYILAGKFSNALTTASTALIIVDDLFRPDSPITTGPPTDAQGRTSAGALRKWTCECIKDGAARYEQRIKCEDIGRCYYYKSISEHIVHGATEQVEADKLTAIGCCVVSDTMTENVPGELLQLDARTMESVRGRGWKDEEEGDEDGWVNEEEDEDGWVDEEWVDEEDDDVE